ncbi:MAG: hypothetical protein Unbinned4052contig1001_31 [Prokaryotic dsDNA virus sp.]|jgi:hypothetical protein|nr:MAG: hypothetical protein Unbinned4052contig1001_31 [Prokaryotic dsDNA virus sp.]|tara:strand:- start:2451 stop:2867 length:417 start_codon:yes stop_codon:yes gene_type:complete
MPRKYHRWPREDLDMLERLVLAGWHDEDIADEMQRELLSVRGAIQRIGLSKARPASFWNRRDDWPEIDTIIVDCLEASLMTVPQVAEHLARIGKRVSVQSVYRRIASMPTEVQNRAKRNGSRRRAAVCSRIKGRRRAA